MKLPKSEEQVMQYLWQRKETFMKDLMESYPDPKPAPSTLATMLSRLRKKKAVDYKKYGSVRAYFPMISKEQYFANQLGGMIQQFFDGSKLQFASFFTEESELSEAELKALREMIDAKLNDRSQDDVSDQS